MPSQNRRPQIGDMLIVWPNYFNRVKHFVGLVSKIELDSRGYQNKVFVSWQSDPAPNYNGSHGYSGMNICNLRNNFQVFRNGKEIP